MKRNLSKLNAFAILIVTAILLTMPMSFADNTCTDSDGGKEPYVFGSATGIVKATDTNFSTLNDVCYKADSIAYSGHPSGGAFVDSCSANELCYVEERVCSSYPSSLNLVGTDDIRCQNGCSDGACKPSADTEITEQVKCVFDNSATAQECWSDKGRCSGTSTCVVDVKGKKGEQITWKSTCGGYVYTTIDGQNDYAKFACSTCVRENPIVVITPNTRTLNSEAGGKYSYEVDIVNKDNAACGPSIFYRWGTHNVPNGGTTDEFAGRDLPAISPGASLKYTMFLSMPSDVPAGNYYVGQIIENTKKSGSSVTARSEVVIAGANTELNPNPPPVIEHTPREVVINPTESNKPVNLPSNDAAEKIIYVCNGCSKESNCYPIGYRMSGEYCGPDKKFIEQLSSDASCENNFECSSNVCASEKCISGDILQRILSWFKRLFGMY